MPFPCQGQNEFELVDHLPEITSLAVRGHDDDKILGAIKACSIEDTYHIIGGKGLYRIVKGLSPAWRK
jgi:hypothetical protein